MANVRLIEHEVIPKCGSFEVRFADGRPRQDLAGSETALEQAKIYASSRAGTADNHSLTIFGQRFEAVWNRTAQNKR
jgi:hypothetical protein